MKTGLESSSPKQQAVGCLTIIAFYYLLRVGEYTKPKYVTRNGKKQRATRTVQYSVENVGFFKGDEILPKDSPLDILLTATSAALKITNQKSGRMGETIHHYSISAKPGSSKCPVQALARRVHHILSNGGTKERLLCEYYGTDGEWHSVESKDIITHIRQAASALDLHKKAIDPDLIGAHSLRAPPL